MKITAHLFKWDNLHNLWLTKYFFASLYKRFGGKFLVFLISWLKCDVSECLAPTAVLSHDLSRRGCFCAESDTCEFLLKHSKSASGESFTDNSNTSSFQQINGERRGREKMMTKPEKTGGGMERAGRSIPDWNVARIRTIFRAGSSSSTEGHARR